MKVTHRAVEIDFENGYGLEVDGSQVMLKIAVGGVPGAWNTMWVDSKEMVQKAWNSSMLDMENCIVETCGNSVTATIFNDDETETVIEMSAEEFLARLTRKETQ